MARASMARASMTRWARGNPGEAGIDRRPLSIDGSRGEGIDDRWSTARGRWSEWADGRWRRATATGDGRWAMGEVVLRWASGNPGERAVNRRWRYRSTVREATDRRRVMGKTIDRIRWEGSRSTSRRVYGATDDGRRTTGDGDEVDEVNEVDEALEIEQERWTTMETWGMTVGGARRWTTHSMAMGAGPPKVNGDRSIVECRRRAARARWSEGGGRGTDRVDVRSRGARIRSRGFALSANERSRVLREGGETSSPTRNACQKKTGAAGGRGRRGASREERRATRD